MSKKAEKKAEKPKSKDWRDDGIARFTVELPQGLVDEIGEHANAKGLKPSHIIRLWLLERAAAERQPAPAPSAIPPGARP